MMKISPAERLDLVRCLLTLLVQAYSASGHNQGRSRCAILLESALDLLGPPRDKARNNIERNMLSLIQKAKDIHSEDAKMNEDKWFETFVLGNGSYNDWVESCRKEIESGFEDRMA